MAVAARPFTRRGFAGKTVAGVLIAAALLGWSILSRTQSKASLKSDLYAQMMEVVQDAPERGVSPEYVSAFEAAHAQAFHDAYSMGGRRTGAKFDMDGYLEAVFGALIAHAEAAGFEEDRAYFAETLAINLDR